MKTFLLTLVSFFSLATLCTATPTETKLAPGIIKLIEYLPFHVTSDPAGFSFSPKKADLADSAIKDGTIICQWTQPRAWGLLGSRNIKLNKDDCAIVKLFGFVELTGIAQFPNELVPGKWRLELLRPSRVFKDWFPRIIAKSHYVDVKPKCGVAEKILEMKAFTEEMIVAKLKKMTKSEVKTVLVSAQFFNFVKDEQEPDSQNGIADVRSKLTEKDIDFLVKLGLLANSSDPNLELFTELRRHSLIIEQYFQTLQ